jgi:hypothetical protein
LDQRRRQHDPGSTENGFRDRRERGRKLDRAKAVQAFLGHNPLRRLEFGRRPPTKPWLWLGVIFGRVQCLQSLGYTVTEASGGQAGLDRIAVDRPDLMVVDFAMPGVGGAQVAVQARQASPDLAVLLVLAIAVRRALEDAIPAGA